MHVCRESGHVPPHAGADASHAGPRGDVVVVVEGGTPHPVRHAAKSLAHIAAPCCAALAQPWRQDSRSAAVRQPWRHALACVTTP